MPNVLFHLQFPAPEAANVIGWTTLMESFDQWDSQLSGSGARTFAPTYLQITTGLSSGGIARIWKAPAYPPMLMSWTKARTIQFRAYTIMDTDPNSENYICTGFGLPTAEGFGFKFHNDKIEGFAADGSAASFVDLLTGLVDAAPTDHRYKAVFTPGVKVEFYIDDVLLGEVTTHLPSGTTYPHIPARFAVKSGANKASIIYVSGFSFQQDL